MRDADRIDKQIKNKLKTSASPELDRRIDDLITQAEKKQTQESNIWRSIMNSKTTKFAIAAVLIIVALIGINHFGSSTDGTDMENVEISKPDADVHETSSVTKLLNGPCIHEFADGSQVKLDEGAKVKLHNSKDKRGFEHIAGQIEVSVAKGKGEFVVTTSFGDVKALGTVFKMDIVNENSIEMLAVKVEEGSVQVSNSQGSVVIQENQSATAVKGQKPYDFRQDENLPKRLIERIDSMLTAIETGDKKLYVSNYNIQAMYDLVKGRIKYADHRDWFSGMGPKDAARIVKGLGGVESIEQLESIFIQDVSDNRHKLYVRSVELDSNGQHAIAACVERRDRRMLRITPQWTYFRNNWWQTDD
ncbi:MAG: FecR domain-containing protein [Planctomycetes bacterium]|nr:FecR domain-containing protein [Planctomycetota bacterium]